MSGCAYKGRALAKPPAFPTIQQEDRPMTDLPAHPGMTPEQAYERLQHWYQKQAQLKKLKQHEHLERVALSEFYFPNQVEGTNRMDLGGGFDLKLQASFNYTVTEEDLDNVAAADIKRLKLPWDELFIYEPKVSISAYRKLNAEQKLFVDAILTIKPGSPQLEIVQAANREAQAEHVEAAEAAKADERVIVLDAETAEPGNFYFDDETWWVLDESSDWAEVEDADEIAILNVQLSDLKAKPAKPKRRRTSK